MATLLAARERAWSKKGTPEERLTSVFKAVIRALVWSRSREGQLAHTGFVVEFAVLAVLTWMRESAVEILRRDPSWKHVFAAPEDVETADDLDLWQFEEQPVSSLAEPMEVEGEEPRDNEVVPARVGSEGSQNRVKTEKADAHHLDQDSMDEVEPEVTGGTHEDSSQIGGPTSTNRAARAKRLRQPETRRRASDRSSSAQKKGKGTKKEIANRERGVTSKTERGFPEMLDGWTPDQTQMMELLTMPQQRSLIKSAIETATMPAKKAAWQRRAKSWWLANGFEEVSENEDSAEDDAEIVRCDEDADDPWDEPKETSRHAATTSSRILRAPRDQVLLPTYGRNLSTDVTDLTVFWEKIERCIALRTLSLRDVQHRVALQLSQEALLVWDALWSEDGMTPRRAMAQMTKWERDVKRDEWQVKFEDLRVRTLPKANFYVDWLELRRLAILLFDKEHVHRELATRIETAVRAIHGNVNRKMWVSWLKAAREEQGAAMHWPTVWSDFVDDRNLETAGGATREPQKQTRHANGMLTPNKRMNDSVSSATSGGATTPRRAATRPVARCYNCGGTGHVVRDCPKPVACFRCCEVGHTTANCPKTERVCRLCRKPGHLAKSCPTAGQRPSGEGQGSPRRSA